MDNCITVMDMLRFIRINQVRLVVGVVGVVEVVEVEVQVDQEVNYLFIYLNINLIIFS
eukprot:SAG11_NODE_26631_length_342_cov_8.514403_1_plen_58_part_00